LNDHAGVSFETFAAEIVDEVASLVFARFPLGSGHDAPVTAPAPAGLPWITVHACVPTAALRRAPSDPPHAATTMSVAIAIAIAIATTRA
jgi:hypothetical protein